MASFVKMHGLGNDFLVFKGPLSFKPETVAQLCSRHFGIGADGLLVVSKVDDFIKMDYWNSDGSPAEMCGNGLRCVTRYAVDNNMTRPGEFKVETPSGQLAVKWEGKDENNIEVQVGKVMVSHEMFTLDKMVFYKVEVGNPHAITFVDDVRSVPVKIIGPKVENDPSFPNKTNVEFARIEAKNKIELRIWERGVGETQACGTGMVSTAVMAKELGKTSFPTTICVPGGMAEVWVDEAGYACLRGPAVYVFEGQVALENL